MFLAVCTVIAGACVDLLGHHLTSICGPTAELSASKHLQAQLQLSYNAWQYSCVAVVLYTCPHAGRKRQPSLPGLPAGLAALRASQGPNHVCLGHPDWRPSVN